MTSADRRLALWGRVLSDGQELQPTRVEVRDGRIVGLEPAAKPRPDDLAVEDGWIAPGLIDLQVNGAAGIDLTSAADPAHALRGVARCLAQHGVTAFCPTLVSSPSDVIVERLRAYTPRAPDAAARPSEAAASLGLHVEGPFLNPAYRGVHEPGALRDASASEIERWIQAGPPAIVTLASERPGGVAAIAQLAAAGVLVSLGHSGADADQAQAGLRAGARLATHLFNAMPALHHRRPGLAGALLASSAVLGLIGDGVHVDRLMVDLVVRRAGPRRVALVSDALAAAGAPPGESRLGDQRLVSDGRVVRRGDGTLAGSAVLLDAGLRNLRAWLPDIPPASLIELATSTPANALGCQTRGRIARGCHADLVVLDADFNVRQTFVGGQPVPRA